RGQTPLAGAAYKGYVDVVRLLLENGAQVNARLPGGKTALRFAAMFDRKEVVELMLAHGADPAITDEEGMTAKAAAQMMGASGTAERLQAPEGPADTEGN